MRNLKIIIILGLTAILPLSCEDFLEETPFSNLSPENFYNNANQANAAVIAAYNPLIQNTCFANLWRYNADFHSDICRPRFDGLGGAWGRQSRFNEFTTDDSRRQSAYGNFYEVIDRANAAIANIPNTESMSEEDINQLVAEAKFLRALAYFELVRAFGPLPLRTEPLVTLDDEILSRSSVQEVYEVIISDLLDGTMFLPPRSQRSNGRATSGAAKSLLGKVYLTRKAEGDAARAYEVLKEVIDSNEYALVDDFLKLASVDHELNEEIVFPIQFSTQIPSTQANGFYRFASAGGIPNTNGFAYMLGEPSFFNGLERSYRTDITFAQTVAMPRPDGGYDTLNVPNNPRPVPITKYLFLIRIGGEDWNAEARVGGMSFGLDYSYLRYADVLLLAAEAINERDNGPNGEAFGYVNMVRQRARTRFASNVLSKEMGDFIEEEVDVLPDLTTADASSKDDFIEVLLAERAIEFVAEGHRRWDLLRMGKYEEKIMNKSNTFGYDPAIHNLYPMPQREMDLHAAVWVQNPGY